MAMPCAASAVLTSVRAVAANPVPMAAWGLIVAALLAIGSIPFLFGGDGAVVMVPPHQIAASRIALARVRGMAVREFGLSLRVGLATVADLRQWGADLDDVLCSGRNAE